MRPLLAALVFALAAPAQAGGPLQDAQQAELDRLRAEVAGEIQLAAYDLIDELVYGWLSQPVFDKPTPVVVAGVTVPVGLGTGMAALVENHLSDVVGQNPATNLQLVYCPTCTAVVVHADAESTVIARGIDDPQVLAALGDQTGRVALFVDIEAEGAFLVLRARLTKLSPELPIVWSHTLTSSTSAPPLLRQPQDLKSASAARQEYIDALHDRGPVLVPLRFVVRTYAQPDDTSGVAPPPFLWLESGAEFGTTDARAWTSSLLMGVSFIPEAYMGLLAQARVSRLIGRRVRSLSGPNLYGFVGAAAITVWGPATAPFLDEPVTADDIVLALAGDNPRTTFGALQMGLDLRLGERVGLSSFLETLPSLGDNGNMGNYIRIAGVEFQTLGTEVSFWF